MVVPCCGSMCWFNMVVRRERARESDSESEREGGGTRYTPIHITQVRLFHILWLPWSTESLALKL
jgi:hypothetical protein